MSSDESEKQPKPGYEQNPVHDETMISPASLPHMTRAQVTGAVLLLVALLAGIYVLGWHSRQAQHAEALSDMHQRTSDTMQVTVVRPRSSNQAGDIMLPCDIRPDQEASIFPRTTGYLKKLHVDIGDKVKAGQLLAEIDTPEVDAQLAQSRATLEAAMANVNRAQSDLRLAQITLNRYQQTERSGGAGVVSAIEMEQRQATYDQALAALAQARASVTAEEANVKRLEVLQNFEKITAPFDGIVTERNFDVGALVVASSPSSGNTLFRITASHPVRVRVNVPQVYASQISLGQNVELNVRNYPRRKFTGTIFLAANSVDADTRTMLCVARFNNPDGALLPGMYAQIKMNIASQEPVLLVPVTAMIFKTSGSQIAIVRDGKIHLKNVTVGRDLGTELEISQGLEADDLVVATPDTRMREGAEVQVVEKTAAQR